MQHIVPHPKAEERALTRKAPMMAPAEVNAHTSQACTSKRANMGARTRR